MHTFYTDMTPGPGEEANLEPREHDHLFKTLRARPGECIRLMNGRGYVAAAEVMAGRSVRVTQACTVTEPTGKLHLFCAVPRKARFDALLKQAAELGVWAIHPVKCERTVAEPEGGKRWTLLLREGCKQSGNPFLPVIHPPLPLTRVLADLPASLTAFYGKTVPNEGGGALQPLDGEVGWFVGPEGGFTAAEEEALSGRGVLPLNLGPYILRLETAAICGLAVLRQRMPRERE